uniref:Periviscerokinin-3 n=2 Tax=Derocalymma TaxID=344691 RepID=PVK3_DERCR|nr:RecName: Full=Periviscerokinin-3; Short=DerVe-PVK-3 [Derocalymma versicolor]P85582.1 RecName: Full=Periviscerokinin-3; Short=DerCr-PVK-3 [Derocalymma cruralis]
GSSGMISFPRT